MMHGPCGLGNPNSPCMVDGKCSKNFPKDFTKQTFAGCDGYPHYRRRDNGQSVIKNGVELDNRYVVPYNPYLSKKYNAHINVEICSSIQSCKYLYKYVYKGPDMASVRMESSNGTEGCYDEIQKYVNSRFVTASEACWRIMSFDVHGRDPSIQRLAVHEENLQMVTFDEDKPHEAIHTVKIQLYLGGLSLIRKTQVQENLGIMKFLRNMFGIQLNTSGIGEKKESALDVYTQQIHHRAKGITYAYFFIIFLEHKVLLTCECHMMAKCTKHSKQQQ